MQSAFASCKWMLFNAVTGHLRERTVDLAILVVLAQCEELDGEFLEVVLHISTHRIVDKEVQRTQGFRTNLRCAAGGELDELGDREAQRALSVVFVVGAFLSSSHTFSRALMHQLGCVMRCWRCGSRSGGHSP